MTIRDELNAISNHVEWQLIKSGPRKSPTQPHVWFGAESGLPRVAIKFFESTDPHSRGLTSVRRELQFHEALASASGCDAIRSSIPRLLHSVSRDDFCCLITEFCTQPRVDQESGQDFARNPLTALDWIRTGVDFLERLRRCDELVQRLGGNNESVLCHGDFSHYNALALARSTPLIIDWEDWSLAPDSTQDIWHMIALPTIVERPMNESIASFRSHWIDGSDYARSATDLAREFLPAADAARRKSLESYLLTQEQRCRDIPRLYDLFAACRRELQASHQ